MSCAPSPHLLEIANAQEHCGGMIRTLHPRRKPYARCSSSHMDISARYREIAGFEGVLAGCLVALKQIMPDNELVLLKVIRFRVKVQP